jgi:predicted transcriptional regulator
MLPLTSGDLAQADLQQRDVSQAGVALPSEARQYDQAVSPINSAMLAWLAPREREVATIVYAHGVLSANEVRRFLVRSLSNSAIRSMLVRLEAKGIIRKRKEGKKFLYAPAIPDQIARERALCRLSQDYFGGSLQEAALALLALVEKHRPGEIQTVARQIVRHRSQRLTPRATSDRSRLTSSLAVDSQAAG